MGGNLASLAAIVYFIFLTLIAILIFLERWGEDEKEWIGEVADGIVD